MVGLLDDFVLWVLGGFASALTAIGIPVGKVVKDNYERSKNNTRVLEGTGPNDRGIRQIVFDTRQRLESMDEKIDDYRRESTRNHEEVMDSLEDINTGD